MDAIEEADRSFDDPFVIIERAGQEYMQCLVKSGWQLEKREGSEKLHFEASRPSDTEGSNERQAFLRKIMKRGERLSPRLDREDVEAVMIAYLMEDDEPHGIVWTRISL